MLCEFVNIESFMVFAENTNEMLNVYIYNCSGVELDLSIEACDSSNCTFVNSQNESSDSRIFTVMMDGSSFNFSLIPSSNYELFIIEAGEADSSFLFTRDNIQQYYIKDDDGNQMKQIALYYTSDCDFINREEYEKDYYRVNNATIEYQYEEGQFFSNPKLLDFSFKFDDDWLFEPSTNINGDLAKACVGLSSAAYKPTMILSCLKQMGFGNAMNVNYLYTPTFYDNDHVCAIIGHKKLRDYDIYVVPIKGTSSDCEWFSNFNLGIGSNHAGFYTAAQEVEKALFDKLKSDGAKP